MRFILFLAISVFVVSCQNNNLPERSSANMTQAKHWQQNVDSILHLYGHRNLILVVDKAFPALASSVDMQVINTNANMIPVLSYLNKAIQKSPHITAHIFRDKEFDYLPVEKGSALCLFKDSVDQVFAHQPIASLLHDSIFTRVAATSQKFQVLILKTNNCVAYCSVYLQLDCKYWDPKKEKELRDLMKPKI